MSSITDLGAVRAFVAVANAGSFARAAAVTGLTRSAVGKAVARLEAQLGTRLLQRSTRRVGLTADGQLFHERCSQMLEDLDEAEATVRQDRPEPSGTLRLALPDAFGRVRILPILHRYLMSWPDLRAEVSFSDRIVDLIDEGYDLAVRIGAAPSDTGLITRVIARSSIVLCAAPSYIEARSAPTSIGDLNEHRRLAFGNRKRPLAWNLRAPDGDLLMVVSPPHLLFDSADAIREAAVLGQGVAYLPDFLVEQDIAAGRLLPVLPECETGELPIHAIYPSRRHLSNKVRLFLDLIVESLR